MGYRYRVRSETVHGSIVSSWWSDQPLKAPSTLYYSQNAEDGGSALLEKLSCTSQSASGLLFVGENATESWGKYFECASGPSMMSEDSEDSSSMSSSSPSLTTNSTTAAGEGVLKTNTTTTTTTSTTSPYASPPPSVVIIHDTNESHVHLVVEENSGGNYPAFLYSVWTARASYGGSAVTIHHMFHIAAQARLAEAIISGLVHGAKTGGQCVYVREQFSWRYPFYSDYAAAGRYRAGPLGEQPGNSTVVKDLSQVKQKKCEEIEENWLRFYFFEVVPYRGVSWYLSLGEISTKKLNGRNSTRFQIYICSVLMMLHAVVK